MQPLNPFLAAFFKSSFLAQCTPVAQHILLVPTTSSLLTTRDRESGALYSELAHTEDFLSSHVLRIQSPHSHEAGKDGGVSGLGWGTVAGGNMREHRGKAKQYNTINGRTVIIKDGFVYANKGFKTLNQAQLVNDALWYPDSLEPRSWLVYYISRPLIGAPEDLLDVRALPVPKLVANGTSLDGADAGQSSAGPKKKDIKSFNELLNAFPMIARQMQPGLEQLFKEFNHVFQKDKPLPPPPSANHIPDPDPDGPIAKTVKQVRQGSQGSINTLSPGPENGSINGGLERTLTNGSYFEDEDTVMRGALETAVTSAIDLFQSVDKAQLSLLGAITELTGPVVERLIERYVAEHLHDSILYPKLQAWRRQEDLELESKIRQMEYIDISQVGIPIQGGQAGKHELTLRLRKAVDEFRKLGVAGSPQQMMDILLTTLRTVTHHDADSGKEESDEEKVSGVLTINADTLVSLLLVVVIRSQVKYLQARLLYMRHFIYIDDVESGEMGYALSTLEAVLSYLQRDSIGLRKASRRNKLLWNATTSGNMRELQKVMEPERCDSPEQYDDEELANGAVHWAGMNGQVDGMFNDFSRRSSSLPQHSRRKSDPPALAHVFPFQASHTEENGIIPEVDSLPPSRRPKSVTLDTRSMSISSEHSWRSRATTIDSISSGIEGDTSTLRLAQTQDVGGESILMMAINAKKPHSLRYLLELEEHYPLPVILQDINNDGTTLLSAAVQLGQHECIEILLRRINQAGERGLAAYLARQDIRGRSVGHYLYNCPWLISRIGRFTPWRQKDKNGQTPLFALCRSYDNDNYQEMVESGIIAAASAQPDGLPLHLDEHVDAKGNTLLHIVNNPQIALRILIRCDVDVNATNDKKFSPLMVASKYGRVDMARILFGDPRVDMAARDLRGVTAVEMAKDDEVRSRIDDLVLFTNPPAEDGRITSVVRSFFVDDATIRLVVKSAMPAREDTYTVTTCKRSLGDFENLARCLGVESPASWVPSVNGMRSPFQIPSKPSRAVLRDIQSRLDGFLRILLSHPTFSTHEMLWEFLLVPDIQQEQMEQRSKLKAEALLDRVREEYDPVEDVRDVEQFVNHARDMVRSVNYALKSVLRRTNALRTVTNDMSDATRILSRSLHLAPFLPPTHTKALNLYIHTLIPPTHHPISTLHTALICLHSTLIALLLSLARPHQLIIQINAHRAMLEKNYNSLSKSTRWPLGLLDDTRQRLDREKEQVIKKEEGEKGRLEKELRYSQQVVAAELAGWQEGRVKNAREAVRELVRGMVVLEKGRLEGIKRAVRALRPEEEAIVEEGVYEDRVMAERMAKGPRKGSR